MDGKYIILRKLGQGAYGEVFLTRHAGLSVHRAVKRILKSQDRYGLGRREADALKSLSHPSLPIIYDVDEDDVYFYIVEEYIEGEPLTEYVRRKGRLTEQEACSLAMSICTVLEYMQNNGVICHLDIKPDNIIITSEGLKLLDFGSSLLDGSMSGYVTGTKGYAAPEMYRGGKLSAGCDIYALGMLIRFMLTGRTVKAQHNNIKCSENLKFIINKCTSREASGRYADALELYHALEQSQTKSINRAAANPIVILVVGSQERVGATHLAVMLASHFNATRRRCLLITADNRKAALPIPLYEGVKHISCAGGIYTVEGLTIMPDYGGYAMPVDEKKLGRYSVIVRDLGNMETVDFNDLKGNGEQDVSLILVAGHTASELLMYEKAAARLDEVGVEYVSAVNFTDAGGYAGIRKEHKMRRAFRIPYCTSPYSFLAESDYIEKTIVQKKTGTHAGYRRFRDKGRLWRDTFHLVCRQLSVKRKKKTGSSL